MIRLVFDVGPGVGMGHRRRMEALAVALNELGVASDLVALGDDPIESDLVVLDSYRVRADGDHVRAHRTVAVDDLRRDLAVDLVVDPAPADGDAARTPARAPRLLDGLDYALVDPALAARPGSCVHDEVSRVLVTTGAADAAGVGARVAEAIRAEVRGAEIRLVMGPWSAATVPDGVTPVQTHDGLADELGAADLVVCASGVTLLEALVLGRPVVALLTAENQRRYYEGLARAGAVAATTPAEAGAVTSHVAADPERRRRLAATARQLVDGLGAQRVARAVAELA